MVRIGLAPLPEAIGGEELRLEKRKALLWLCLLHATPVGARTEHLRVWEERLNRPRHHRGASQQVVAVDASKVVWIGACTSGFHAGRILCGGATELYVMFRDWLVNSTPSAEASSEPAASQDVREPA